MEMKFYRRIYYPRFLLLIAGLVLAYVVLIMLKGMGSV